MQFSIVMTVLWARFELDLTYFLCVCGPIMFIGILSLQKVGLNDPTPITYAAFSIVFN